MAFSSLGFGLLLSAITAVVGKRIEGVREAKRLKNIAKDTAQAIENAGTSLDEMPTVGSNDDR